MKLERLLPMLRHTLVLIGPCGIETRFVEEPILEVVVLIGPCGIETEENEHLRQNRQLVLIGPCGIETKI